MLCSHSFGVAIDVASKDGRVFRGVPKMLTKTNLVVSRLSDKKVFSIPLSKLTDDTIELSKRVIKEANLKSEIKEEARKREALQHLNKHSVESRFGRVTLYTSVDNCAFESNYGYVSLIAPDRSKCTLSMRSEKTKTEILKYMNDSIKSGMRGLTQPERDNGIKNIKVHAINIGEWSGYETVDGRQKGKSRSRTVYLKKEGNYFCFSYSEFYDYSYYSNRKKKPKINHAEWEDIIKNIRIDPAMK